MLTLDTARGEATDWIARNDGFGLRLAVLVGVMLLVAAIDYARNRARATRWREYSFLLAMGSVGAAAGMAIDLVTSSISPEYFVEGKGLSAGASFRIEVLRLGAQAGFVVGCIGAGALLVANAAGKRRSSLPQRRLVVHSLAVVGIALAGASVLGACGAVLGLSTPSVTGVTIEPERLPRFEAVWWAHLGAYAGALVGLAARIVAIRRRRDVRSASTAPSSPENCGRSPGATRESPQSSY